MIIDYETFPLSRKEIRSFAKMMRTILGIKTLKFPVLDVLESIYDLYGVTYEIMKDEVIDAKNGNQVMCYLQKQIEGQYSIVIRQSVYDNACHGNGCSIDYICHEICHFFLIEVFGYYPIYNVCLSENRQIPKYRSMEWQAKALCGEVMIDYKKCSNMTIFEIMKKTGSSIDQACFYKMFVANK